jgi:hypothetical protein
LSFFWPGLRIPTNSALFWRKTPDGSTTFPDPARWLGFGRCGVWLKPVRRRAGIHRR